ncbi:MAG: lipoate--protein ligase family protein [Acidimicrobiia bacterium]
MDDGIVTVIRHQSTGDGPLDTAVSRAVLDAVGKGTMGESLEVSATGQILAFGKQDAGTPGFDAAVDRAEGLRYQSTVRIVGGRAAAFHDATIRFGWTRPIDDAASAMADGFARLTRAVVAALASFGIRGEVGETPGEYCPGKWSVHIAGRKVMGVGQRLTRTAAHVGGVIVVDGAQRINEVLLPVYGALGLPFDPSVTGSLSDAMVIPTGDFIDAFVGELCRGRTVVAGTVPDHLLRVAHDLRSDHDPKARRPVCRTSDFARDSPS